MVRTTILALAASLALGLAPQALEAQGKGKHRNDRDRDRYEDVARPGDRDERRGPKFCRNGEGHPVHGREWCVRKGFGLGEDVWREAGWEDVIFGRRDRRDRDRRLDRGTLADVLGGVILGRFDAHRRSLGVDAPLEGRWLDEGALVLSAGGVPLARLADRDRDGRVETVLLRAR